jgi:hypothetical protein
LRIVGRFQQEITIQGVHPGHHPLFGSLHTMHKAQNTGTALVMNLHPVLRAEGLFQVQMLLLHHRACKLKLPQQR